MTEVENTLILAPRMCVGLGSYGQQFCWYHDESCYHFLVTKTDMLAVISDDTINLLPDGTPAEERLQTWIHVHYMSLTDVAYLSTMRSQISQFKQQIAAF
eukprot:s791_g6.t1